MQFDNRSPLRPPEAPTVLIPDGWAPTPARLEPYLEKMILSASGWRTVFAADGDEESVTPDVRPEHLVLAALAARAFAGVARRDGRPLRVAVGQDTRPTGSLICQAAIRMLRERGAEPVYAFVTPSPEIMAFTRTSNDLDGFFYVSASHNPVGHNGLKMGMADGSVAGGETSRKLIAAFRALATDPEAVAAAAQAIRGPGTASEKSIYNSIADTKAIASRRYRDAAEEVVRGPGPFAEQALAGLREKARAIQPGIIADLNGSARCLSIDREMLSDFGCRYESANDIPGIMSHQIVPEGEGLAQCVRLLADKSAAEPGFILGYVPDNDGDRGNLVISDKPGVARPLEAQEVFALSAVAELAWLAHTGALEVPANPGGGQTPGNGRPRFAVVVNGPTSMRVERIGGMFGVEVHRAEVGEANVVGLARKLRAEGCRVRFLGEGSNGGNITHPGTVRDPIQTLFALLKLLYTPASANRPSPANTWLGLARGATAGGRPSLSELIDALPRFTTTNTFSPEAIMKVETKDHSGLKDVVEHLWEQEWAGLDELRSTLGLTGYRFENYEGTERRPGPGNRTEPGRGGFKILLLDADGVDRAFLWMRGSGTEPVFRILVDVEGDQPGAEAKLREVLRRMVNTADKQVSATAT